MDPAISGPVTLSSVLERFRRETQLTPVIGVELEFYLIEAESEQSDQILECCRRQMSEAGTLGEIAEEAGPLQYEIRLSSSEDPLAICRSIELAKAALHVGAAQCGADVSFAARLDYALPPSGMHIHLSLCDHFGANLFAKPQGTDDESAAMQFVVAGLCDWMNASMVYFAPFERSYERFNRPVAEGPYRFSNAPPAVCWGGNNRTVAIRIPTSTTHPEGRHIEHRVPCADADPASAISAILAASAHGLSNQLVLSHDKVWGDATDEANDWPLARSLSEAHAYAAQCSALRNWMTS